MAISHEVVVAPIAALQQRLRRLVQEASRRAVAEGRRFSLAIPGGSVVTQLLVALRADDIDWSSTDIFWCDERAVAPGHPDSNYGASIAGWLGALRATGVRLHRMEGDDPSLDEAARRYEVALVASLGSPPILDMAVVGIGEDGHVCSLFPGHPALRETGRVALAVRGAPKPPPDRVSLSLPVVAGARCLVAAALGASKHAAMREVLEDQQAASPIAQLLRRSASAVVLLDEAAAHGSEPQAVVGRV
ncbi:MAG: 6-phosphogluconolactonase [Gemmatimonadetes bacterium]|nr:6-phosphogluconolactonase [Gemmatimonadota bacterium]